MLVDIDSRALTMEAGTGSEVRNSLPAESTSPENGWRLSAGLIPDRRRRERPSGPARSRRVGGSRWFASKALGVGPAGASTGADLGGSSKYSSENLED